MLLLLALAMLAQPTSAWWGSSNQEDDDDDVDGTDSGRSAAGGNEAKYGAQIFARDSSNADFDST